MNKSKVLSVPVAITAYANRSEGFRCLSRVSSAATIGPSVCVRNGNLPGEAHYTCGSPVRTRSCFRDAGFCEIRPRRRANRLKPAAYVDLRVGFAAEVPSASRARGIHIPLEHRELRIATLNDKPVIGIVGDSSTDFTSEFLKSRHAIALFSYGSTRLRIM